VLFRVFFLLGVLVAVKVRACEGSPERPAVPSKWSDVRCMAGKVTTWLRDACTRRQSRVQHPHCAGTDDCPLQARDGCGYCPHDIVAGCAVELERLCAAGVLEAESDDQEHPVEEAVLRIAARKTDSFMSHFRKELRLCTYRALCKLFDGPPIAMSMITVSYPPGDEGRYNGEQIAQSHPLPQAKDFR